ncbi:hypothetical protein SAMN04489761_0891 [Tenacibaculum sp. MAR_2009_124]|uniref:hypothetical protein n=1 Tax=Tenacibaculum sp. MAR_2009_124 TaxID=1250059 RepID=UPI00089BAD7C|nr:hypothetical protein [Tenacibaculum sp. MAR_2009_124]SEB46763.1 hypothetical protein SAMN04489761_0891 [Tenacibaculum sp. MAR_2009_124]
MKQLYHIVKLDYLQRTRSYSFLITLCLTLAIAYTFIPHPNANYSTIRVADYVGFYNSAWIGNVTAVMTSVFLSLIGFYLVNTGIKKDGETKVGQIIASTQIKNSAYLITKALSNFLVLSTIVVIVFIMSLILFTLYNNGYSFELRHFIKPYLLITVPAIFLVSVIAVVFEILFGKYTVIQNVGFFFLFTAVMSFNTQNENYFSFDPFGNQIVVHQIEQDVKAMINQDENINLSVGYIIGDKTKIQKFQFNGVDFPISFIVSRFIWIGFGTLLIFVVSLFFHRFDNKRIASNKRTISGTVSSKGSNSISLLTLPSVSYNGNILPILKTEILLLFRKGKKWLWILNIIGMILLAVLPLKIAHQIVLPILWFLQVSRLSDLTIKETINNVHYFTFTSYNPIKRLLFAQLLSGFILMLTLALPLVIRLGVEGNLMAVCSVFLGSILLVLFSSILGLFSKGKKLFEVLFFFITYLVVNGMTFLDYYGGFQHDKMYIPWITSLVLFLSLGNVLKRKQELNR